MPSYILSLLLASRASCFEEATNTDLSEICKPASLMQLYALAMALDISVGRVILDHNNQRTKSSTNVLSLMEGISHVNFSHTWWR